MNVKEIIAKLHELSSDYQQPFTLYVKGYKYSEISQIMHLPLGTIKSRIFFARRQLRNELNDFRD